MNILDGIKTRKSIRAFFNKPVEDEKLLQVLEAGRLSPSASNRQEWRYIIVKDQKKKEDLMKAAGNQRFIAEAPIIIVACAVSDGHIMKCGQLSYPIDVAISLDHMTLAAVELGLGTCWIGLFDENKVKRLLGIPEAIRVVQLMPLGYPSNPSRIRKDRLSLDTIVKYECW